MSKAGVIEEFVIPLLKHLERVKRKASAYNDRHPNIKDMFKKVHKEVEIAKNVLSKAKNWEGKLVDTFGTIEKHLDCMFDDDASRLTTELEAIQNKTEEMNKMLKSLKGLLDAKAPKLPSEQSKSEVGETSETKTIDEGDGKDEISYSFDVEKIIKFNPELALCFCSLSVFPENYKLNKRMLIHWWIALEIVQTGKTKTDKDIGKIFFNDLVSLGILIPPTGTASGVVEGCIIEPNFHKQLIATAKISNFLIQDKSNSAYHFRVSEIQTDKGIVDTVINVNEKYLKSDYILKSLMDNNNICMMQMGQCSMEPRHIEVDKTDFLKELKPNLTYLSLQGISRITELPDSIGDLENLIVLDLRACHNLEKLPPKFKSVHKLKHLDVSLCYLLDHLPKWISSLYNLEALKGFVIGSSRNRDTCRLADLANLDNLRKLSMTIGRELVVGPEELQSLKRLPKLRSLTIIWGAGGYNATTTNIALPENLEKLDFRCYPQETPQWFDSVELKNLKKLYIRGGQLKKFVNKMATVEMLRLRFLQNFVMPLHEIHSIFTNLRYLEHVECKEMEKIDTVDGFWIKEKDGPSLPDPPTDKKGSNKSTPSM